MADAVDRLKHALTLSTLDGTVRVRADDVIAMLQRAGAIPGGADSAAPAGLPPMERSTPAEGRFLNAVASIVGEAVEGGALFSRRYRVAWAALEALRAEPGVELAPLLATSAAPTVLRAEDGGEWRSDHPAAGRQLERPAVVTQDAGEARRQALGIDGTMGDAQDVQHPYVDEGGTWASCLVCGLARRAAVHAAEPRGDATAEPPAVDWRARAKSLGGDYGRASATIAQLRGENARLRERLRPARGRSLAGPTYETAADYDLSLQLVPRSAQVACVGNSGRIHAVGKVVGYFDHPTFLVELDDGTRKSWSARLVREVEPAGPLPPAEGEDDAEVWIPPAGDCMNHRHDPPCPHCSSRVFHHRTGRCGSCGRRPAPAVDGLAAQQPADSPAAPADDTAAPDLRDVGPLRRELADGIARDGDGVDHLPPREVLRRLDALPTPAIATGAPDGPTDVESLRQERDFLAGCLRASSANEAKYVEDSVTLTQLLTWLRRTAAQWRTGSTVLERDRKIRTSCAESLESLIEQVVPSAAGQPVRDSQPEATDG